MTSDCTKRLGYRLFIKKYGLRQKFRLRRGTHNTVSKNDYVSPIGSTATVYVAVHKPVSLNRCAFYQSARLRAWFLLTD